MSSKKWLLDEYLFAKEELEPKIQRSTYHAFWLHRPVLHVPQGVFQPEFMMLTAGEGDAHFTVYTLMGVDRPRQAVEIGSKYSNRFYQQMVRPRDSAGYWPQTIQCDKELSLLSPDTEVWNDPIAGHLNTMLNEGVILAWLEKPAFRAPEFVFDFMVVEAYGKMVFYLKTKSKPNKTTLATLHWLMSLYPCFEFRPIFNTSKELEEAARQLGLGGGL